MRQLNIYKGVLLNLAPWLVSLLVCVFFIVMRAFFCRTVILTLWLCIFYISFNLNGTQNIVSIVRGYYRLNGWLLNDVRLYVIVSKSL